MGFDDLFDGFDDIIGDKNKGGSSPEGQKEDSWGEEKHWNTGKGEDIWRSASPDAVWNSGQPARHTDTSPKPDPDDSEDDEVYEEDDEGYEEEDDYDDEDDDGGLDLDF